MPGTLSDKANGVHRWLRRSLREFIGLPALVVAGFVVLFAAVYAVDERLWGQGGPEPWPWLARLLGDASAISSLLGTVATGMITVTSITFSLLLVAVQQTAASLSTHVYDQFIQRRSNQLSFGFFVGLSIFVLFTLATASSAHRPVLGATLSLLLTGIALCMVVILIYSTVDQMRPYTVIRAIHDLTLSARHAERRRLAATRRTVSPELSWSHLLRADRYGVVGGIDVARIERALADLAGRGPRGRFEVELVAVPGTNLARRDPFVRLHAESPLSDDLCDRLDAAVRPAIAIEPRRTLEEDAGFGIEQLVSIAWTTGSTSKQNPQPAILVCHGLRDLIARGAQAAAIEANPTSRIVYADRFVEDGVGALTTIGVVSSESLQNLLAAEVWRSLAALIEDTPADRLPLLTDSVLRLLSTLGDHVMTREVERGLSACEDALRGRGEAETAEALREAAAGLGQSVGHLNARGTRMPQPA